MRGVIGVLIIYIVIDKGSVQELKRVRIGGTKKNIPDIRTSVARLVSVLLTRLAEFRSVLSMYRLRYV